MSMSTHCKGFKPPDEKWVVMKKVWDSCRAAGIDVPKEVDKFFEYETPDPAGVVVDLGAAALPYKGEGQSGYEIDLTKLPPDVKIIRFYNSW